MPLTNINFNQTNLKANNVAFNNLSSNNIFFDGVDYYLTTLIDGVEYLNKLILKQNVPFYNFIFSSGETINISNVNISNYLIVNTNVDTFSANFGSFTLGLSNIYVSSNFNNCQLKVNLGPGLSCNKTNIFVTTDAVLSSNTNQFYTFSYYNTGSLILGFSLSGISQPSVTPQIPNFPTPTPSITPTISITPTVSITPTITPTITNIGNKDISIFNLTDLIITGLRFKTSASPVIYDWNASPALFTNYFDSSLEFVISAREVPYTHYESVYLFSETYGPYNEFYTYKLIYYRETHNYTEAQDITIASEINNRTNFNIPVTGWTLQPNTSGKFVAFRITSTPTPTPTITPTISITPTITRTVTPTISITPSITPTISITPSITPTIPLTPTPTSISQGFPLSITLSGSNFGGTGSITSTEVTLLSTLTNPIYSLGDFDYNAFDGPNNLINSYYYAEPNGSGGYDYVVFYFLVLNPLNVGYNLGVSGSRWFIGTGYTFSGDNDGWYVNRGYIHNRNQNQQNPFVAPLTAISNWSPVGGQINSFNLNKITFNF